MKNLIRIASVKSNTCFYEDFKSSRIFAMKNDDEEFKTCDNGATLLAHMSQCWIWSNPINTSLFAISRSEGKLTPFSYAWKKCLIFSHEVFRNASISVPEDFNVSNYDDNGNEVDSKTYSYYWNSIEDDYIFYIYRMYH